MKKTRTRAIAMISIMSAIAFVLYYFEISVGFLFPTAAFLKIDFSDIPAVFVGVVLGPLAGIAVEGIKNILHLIFITKEVAASGEIGNFVSGVLFIVPIIVALNTNDKKKVIVAMVLGSIFMTIAMCFVNYFITLPLYGIPAEGRIPLLMSAFIPFNLLKGAILSVVIYVLWRNLANTIERLK